jgi:hypothetical protein
MASTQQDPWEKVVRFYYEVLYLTVDPAHLSFTLDDPKRDSRIKSLGIENLLDDFKNYQHIAKNACEELLPWHNPVITEKNKKIRRLELTLGTSSVITCLYGYHLLPKINPSNFTQAIPALIGSALLFVASAAFLFSAYHVSKKKTADFIKFLTTFEEASEKAYSLFRKLNSEFVSMTEKYNCMINPSKEEKDRMTKNLDFLNELRMQLSKEAFCSDKIYSFYEKYFASPETPLAKPEITPAK